MPLPPPTPHPLPWSTRSRVRLQANWDGDTPERPYALRIGAFDGMIATLTDDDLAALGNQIAAALAAPYRVFVAGGDDYSPNDQALTGEVRNCLDSIRTAHSRMELATERELTAAGRIAEQWAVDTGTPMLLYPRIGDALGDGGNLLVLVAGPDALELAGTAHHARIPIRLIRLIRLNTQGSDHGNG